MRDLSQLPPQILDWFSSDDVSGAVALVNDDLGLPPELHGIVPKALYDIETGLLTPSKLADRLQYEFHDLSEEKIRDAAERLNRLTILPIVSRLKEVHGEEFDVPGSADLVPHLAPPMTARTLEAAMPEEKREEVKSEGPSLTERLKPLSVPTVQGKEDLFARTLEAQRTKEAEALRIKTEGSSPARPASFGVQTRSSSFDIKEIEEQHHHRTFTNTAFALSENKNPLAQAPAPAPKENELRPLGGDPFLTAWEEHKDSLLKEAAAFRIRPEALRKKEEREAKEAAKSEPVASPEKIAPAKETMPAAEQIVKEHVETALPIAKEVPLAIEPAAEPRTEIVLTEPVAAPIETNEVSKESESSEASSPTKKGPEATPKIPEPTPAPSVLLTETLQAAPIAEVPSPEPLPEEKTLEDLLMPETISFAETNPEVAAPIVIEAEQKEAPEEKAETGTEKAPVIPEAIKIPVRPSFSEKKASKENEDRSSELHPFILHEEKTDKEPGVRTFQSYEAIKPSFYKPAFSTAERSEENVSARLEFGAEEEGEAPVVARTGSMRPRVVHYSSLKTEAPFGKMQGAPEGQKAEYIHPRNVLNLKKDDGSGKNDPRVHPENVIDLKDLPQ